LDRIRPWGKRPRSTLSGRSISVSRSTGKMRPRRSRLRRDRRAGFGYEYGYELTTVAATLVMGDELGATDVMGFEESAIVRRVLGVGEDGDDGEGEMDGGERRGRRGSGRA
jgi:hypothetical protein